MPPGIWKPSPSAYGQFVQAVATRYTGHFIPTGNSPPLPRVQFWEVWNEPNWGSSLAPQFQIHSTRREHHLLGSIDGSDDNRALVNIQGNETLSRNSCKHEVCPPCSGNDQNESMPFGFRSVHTPIRAALFYAPS